MTIHSMERSLSNRDAAVRAELHPGLGRLRYRIGTHHAFLSDLRRALPYADDGLLALLDAWAFVADVTTFYQDVLVNEQYVRTANEARSLLEIGGLVASRPRPGLAASTHLALTVAKGTSVELRRVSAQSNPAPGETPQAFEASDHIVAHATLNLLRPRQTRRPMVEVERQTTLDLRGSAAPRVWDPLVLSWDGRRFLFQVVAVQELGDKAYRVSMTAWGAAAASPPENASIRAHLLRTRTSLFGASAPYVPEYADATSGRVIGWQEPLLLQEDGKLEVLWLDGVYEGIEIDAPIVIVRGTAILLRSVKDVSVRGRSAYGLTQKSTRVELHGAKSDSTADFARHREVVVYARAEPFEVLESPLETPVSGVSIELETLAEGIHAGRQLVILDRTNPDSATVRTVQDFVHRHGRTSITLTEPLLGNYLRSDTVIYANVVHATHGQTQGLGGTEVLGSGDGSRAEQSFLLPRSPLTHVLADDGSIEAALDVWVDDVRWTPTADGDQPRPGSKSYTTATDDQHRTSVVFGNGGLAARLPTGVENVRAQYRVGLGRVGNVARNQITLLTERPLGLEAVTNPLPAVGGADPDVESPELLRVASARAGIIDRIVSVRDYAAFARTFGGVEKAHARRTVKNGLEGIELTLSMAGQEVTDRPDERHLALHKELLRRGDPGRTIWIRAATRVRARVHVHLLVDSQYRWPDVEKAVRARVFESFGFARRRLAEAMYPSQIVTEILEVGGVIHAHVWALDPPPPALPESANEPTLVYFEPLDSDSVHIEELPR